METRHLRRAQVEVAVHTGQYRIEGCQACRENNTRGGLDKEKKEKSGTDVLDCYSSTTSSPFIPP